MSYRGNVVDSQGIILLRTQKLICFLEDTGPRILRLTQVLFPWPLWVILSESPSLFNPLHSRYLEKMCNEHHTHTHTHTHTPHIPFPIPCDPLSVLGQANERYFLNLKGVCFMDRRLLIFREHLPPVMVIWGKRSCQGRAAPSPHSQNESPAESHLHLGRNVIISCLPWCFG